MRSLPSGRLSFVGLAWRHLSAERESSAGVALTMLLTLLPAVLLFVDWSSARADLQAVVAASDGVTLQKAGVTTAPAFDAFQQQAQDQVARDLGQLVGSGDVHGTDGPFRVDSINSQQPTPPRVTTAVTVAYVPDLASHVEVVQGVITGSRAAGPTATMAQAAADRMGVHLFDTVCLSALLPGAAGSSPWCARIVGLWRPTRDGDSQLTAQSTNLRFFAERDEFFALSGIQPPQLAEAFQQHRPRAGAVDSENSAKVAERVRDLRASVVAGGLGQLRTSLDTSLERYLTARSAVGFPVRLLAASLVPLLALLLAALARWYIELRLHELVLLRARGWASIRVQSFVLMQFAVLGAFAVAVACVGLFLLAWPTVNGSAGLQLLSPDRSELLAIVVAEGILIAAAASWFVGLARWAARQSVGRLTHADAEPPIVPSWWRVDRRVWLALPAAVLLLFPRVIGTERWLAPNTLDDLGGLLGSVAGLAILVVAVLPAMALIAEAADRGQVEVDRMLARWGLRLWWQQRAAAGSVIVLAFAMGCFASISLAHQLLDRPAVSARSLGLGDIVGLGMGFTGLVVTALLAYGLAFLFAYRSRVDDYAALIVDGLSPASLKRSLAFEQHAVLVQGLLVGLVLGLVLAWTTSSVMGLGTGAGTMTRSAIIGLLATAAIGAPAGAAVARLVRNAAVGFHLVERGRLGT